MDLLAEMVRNPVVVAAFLAWFAAQLSKTIIHVIINKKFAFERLFGDGGMPSSHSSAVCGLASAVGFQHGAAGAEFAIAAVFALIVMKDAMGVRRAAANQARTINEMLELFDTLGANLPVRDKLKEFVGHTPFQVLIGGLLGIATGIIVTNLM